jgi:hypothetical protein
MNVFAAVPDCAVNYAWHLPAHMFDVLVALFSIGIANIAMGISAYLLFYVRLAEWGRRLAVAALVISFAVVVVSLCMTAFWSGDTPC